jgi:hypothetical protein
MTTDNFYYEPGTDISRMSEVSNVYETIAPARGVAEQREDYIRKKEIAEKLREEKMQKQKEEEEAGLAEDQTNLPLEMLMKAKLEQKIKDEMLKAMQTGDHSNVPNINLATT